jgi:dipeptidyl aminopeptidase/acylaminoacyl peptidase
MLALGALVVILALTLGGLPREARPASQAFQSPIETPTQPPYPPPGTPTPIETPTPVTPGVWRAENIQIVRRSHLGVPSSFLAQPKTRFTRARFAPDSSRLLIEFFTGKYSEMKERGGVALVPKGQLWLIETIDRPQVRMTHIASDAKGGAWSPDGTKIAYIKITPAKQFELWVIDLTRNTQKRLAENVVGGHAIWRGNTHLLFVDNASHLLYQVSLDGSITGPLLPIPVFGEGASFSVSHSGEEIVVVSDWNRAQLFDLRKGISLDLPSVASEGITNALGRWAWSYDDRYFAYFTSSGTLMIIDTEKARSVNSIPTGDGFLAWSPDAQSLLLLQSYREHSTLRAIDREDGSSERILLEEERPLLGLAWSPDGRWVLLEARAQEYPVLVELALTR